MFWFGLLNAAVVVEMSEDDHPHVILAHQDTLALHLPAVWDRGPEAVIILLLPSKGIIQGTEHNKSLLTLMASTDGACIFQSLGGTWLV